MISNGPGHPCISPCMTEASMHRQLICHSQSLGLTEMRLRVCESRISEMTTVWRTAPMSVLYQALLACASSPSSSAAAAAAARSLPNQDLRVMFDFALLPMSPATAAASHAVRGQLGQTLHGYRGAFCSI